MQTVDDVKRAADECLFSNEFEEALRLYLQIVELQPLNLDARLRVADALLALGEPQRAAVVYARLAQYAAPAGYPLRALTALKILSALEPELGALVRGVGELYGRDSVRLGRGVRRSLPSGEAPLPRGSLPPDGELAELAIEAERLASDYAHKDALLPDKLMPIPLLSLLGHADLTRVFGACELLRVRPSAVVIEQGSKGRSLYLLARGTVRVQRTSADGKVHELATLREGAAFGELSFLSGAARSAAVIALSDCDLLELSFAALERLGEASLQLQRAVSAFAHERLLAHLMVSSPLFAPLEAAQRLDLIKRFVELQVPASEEIVREGEPGQGAYVVLRGEVSVHRNEGGNSVELARLGPGELFGEMSLLSGTVANASVRAREPSTLLLLAKPYFDRLLEALPDVRAQLEQLADRRSQEIARSSAPIAEQNDSIDVEVLL